MPSTISRTVAMAIPIPEAEALKSKTTAKIIAQLEQREEQLLGAIWQAIETTEGREAAERLVFGVLREHGFLGT